MVIVFLNLYKTHLEKVNDVKSITEMEEMLANEADEELFQQYITMFNDAKIEYEKMSKEAKQLSEKLKN